MDRPAANRNVPAGHTRLLTTLEGLLAIQAFELESALTQASDLVNKALAAEKTDVFLYDAAVDMLIAVGTSDTALGRKQVGLDLHRLPLAGGGTTVRVFQSGTSFLAGRLDQERDERRDIVEKLGVRSTVGVPLEVNGVRRGVVQVASAQPEQFDEADVPFLEAVAHWVGMVLDRTELVEQIARHAAEEARRETANELITILAHDLRTPLVPIRGYLGLIRMQAEREGHEPYLSFVNGAEGGVKRIEALLSDLLDASRLEQGIFALTPEPLNLADLVRETADALQMPTAAIEVRAPEQVVVEADANRLRQALENLLTNALCYSPQGVPVMLELHTEQHVATITVRDAGPGIAPDLLPRVFERFTTQGSSTGLGLGLYLAHGIAAAHGGTLTVDSMPGEGATFRLSLPLPEAQR